MVLQTDEDRSLWEAVGKLKPTYRGVIHLYYYEGYSTDEIGELLILPGTTVRTRLRRARQLLQKELEGVTEHV